MALPCRLCLNHSVALRVWGPQDRFLFAHNVSVLEMRVTRGYGVSYVQFPSDAHFDASLVRFRVKDDEGRESIARALPITDTLFKIRVPSRGGRTVTVTPENDHESFLRNVNAAYLLFEPQSVSLRMPEVDCAPPFPNITARAAKYFSGRVSPKGRPPPPWPPCDLYSLCAVSVSVSGRVRDWGLQLEGVKITAIVEHVTSRAAGITVGSTAATASTNTRGVFSIGPLDVAGVEYRFVANKIGYHFKQITPDVDATVDLEFIHQRLGAVNVTVVDKDGVGVAGVVLMLSGDQYRNSVASDAAGAAVFETVFPGTYYIRPMLKEYTFSPASVEVDVTEGSIAEATITATRMAWSAFGRVLALNGRPVANVTVVASAPQIAAEKALPDATVRCCAVTCPHCCPHDVEWYCCHISGRVPLARAGPRRGVHCHGVFKWEHAVIFPCKHGGHSGQGGACLLAPMAPHVRGLLEDCKSGFACDTGQVRVRFCCEAT